VPKYSALDQPIRIKTSQSDLLELTWRQRGIVADFEIPGDLERVLRVHFEKADILRVVDEMPLSTENGDSKSEGLVPEHFAYLVEDSAFFKAQSWAFKISNPKALHYRFVTGWNCLDVISNAKPSLSVVTRSPISSRE
jgi:hypothetical protein